MSIKGEQFFVYDLYTFRVSEAFYANVGDFIDSLPIWKRATT